jgi:outer membrane protein TolC
MKLFISIGLLLLSFSTQRLLAAESENPQPSAPTLTLEELLKNSQNHGLVQETAQEIEIARSQLDRAKAAFWPKASAGILGAPIFEETGDALNSKTNLNKWGPFLRGSLEFAQPLYTFGMLSSYEKAATSQLTAKTELTQAKRNEVLYQAKEIYYGYLMACEFERLLESLSSFLKEAVDSAEESLKEEDKKGSVKPHDLYRLKTALDDLDQKALYADAAKKTAEKALVWLSGAEFSKVAANSLSVPNYQKKTLDEYIQLSKANRPELKALPAGIQAYEALADAKQLQDYPVVFFGGFTELNWSPVRTRQNSQFAYDPFNRPQGGLGLGLKIDLEFKRHSAEAQEQRAQAAKLKATEAYAVPGIELEVKKAFYELEQAEKSLEVAIRRKDTAKKWFVSNSMGWTVGLTPAKDLLESIEGSGLARKNHIETLYSLNLALAKLSKAVGREITAIAH